LGGCELLQPGGSASWVVMLYYAGNPVTVNL